MLVYPMMARPLGRSSNITGHVIMRTMLKVVWKLPLPLEGPALFKGEVENVFLGWNWFKVTDAATNLGRFDVDYFVPIINPPEAAILAVGKIEKKPVIIQDAIGIRSMMTLCLAHDHRVMDGAGAARFLQAIKNNLQDPASLLP